MRKGTVLSLSLLLTVAIMLIAAGCQKLTAPEDSETRSLIPAGLEKATDSWMKLTPVPTASIFSVGVEGMSVGVVGNQIIAAFGFDQVDRSTTRLYDIDTDSWSLGAAGPGTNSEGTGVTHGGLFYTIGGRGPGSNANWAYDPTTNSWTTLSPLPTARMGLAAAVVGNSIYAIGGRTGSGPNSGGKVNVVERYDIATDTWAAVSPLPSARSDLAAATVGGKIYVFGGFDNTGAVLNTVDVYDPVTDTWTSGLAPMPTARGAMYAVGSSGGRIYVIGGWDGIFPFNATVGATVEAYKVAQDKWITGLTPMPTARAETGAASHGGRIFVVGGATPGFGASVDANEVYKP